MTPAEEPLLSSTSDDNQLRFHTSHQQRLQHQQDEESLNKTQSLVQEIWLENKIIWQIAGPSSFTRLAMFSLTVITQSFGGHLGNRNLAAISIVTTVLISITFGFLLGMASALETLCGKAYGAKQYHMLGIYLQRSWVVLSISSVFLLPLFLFATPILKFTGQSDAVSELTGEVALWLIPMHLSLPFQFTLMRFLQCQLKTGVIAWLSGGVLVVQVLLSWIFVGHVRVGITGAAVILDLSWWLSVVGLFSYSVFGGCPHSWTGFSNQAFHGLWEFFKLSFASGVMLSLENFFYRVLIIVSGNMEFAEVAVDALSICITMYAWESMIPLGFFAATGSSCWIWLASTGGICEYRKLLHCWNASRDCLGMVSQFWNQGHLGWNDNWDHCSDIYTRHYHNQVSREKRGTARFHSSGGLTGFQLLEL